MAEQCGMQLLVPFALIGGIVGDKRDNYHIIARETRCRVILERKDLSPRSDARVVTISGRPYAVQTAMRRIMDLVHLLFNEARVLPTTTSYTYVYGKVTLHIPSHFANVLSSRRDMVEEMVEEGGQMTIASFEEMPLGATKRQVQIYGTEMEVHTAIAKLDASLQRHLIWRRKERIEGDEVIIKAVVANSDLMFIQGQESVTSQRLATRFNVSIQFSPVRKFDKTIVTISGLADSVVQVQMEMAMAITAKEDASKLLWTNNAPTLIKTNPDPNDRISPHSSRHHSLDRRDSTSARLNNQTDNSRERGAVRQSTNVRRSLNSTPNDEDTEEGEIIIKTEPSANVPSVENWDPNTVGRVTIPSRDPRLQRNKTPVQLRTPLESSQEVIYIKSEPVEDDPKTTPVLPKRSPINVTPAASVPNANGTELRTVASSPMPARAPTTSPIPQRKETVAPQPSSNEIYIKEEPIDVSTVAAPRPTASTQVASRSIQAHQSSHHAVRENSAQSSALSSPAVQHASSRDPSVGRIPQPQTNPHQQTKTNNVATVPASCDSHRATNDVAPASNNSAPAPAAPASSSSVAAHSGKRKAPPAAPEQSKRPNNEVNANTSVAPPVQANPPDQELIHDMDEQATSVKIHVPMAIAQRIIAHGFRKLTFPKTIIKFENDRNREDFVVITIEGHWAETLAAQNKIHLLSQQPTKS